MSFFFFPEIGHGATAPCRRWVHGDLPGNALHLADHAPILHGLFLNFIGRRDLEFQLEGLFLLHGLYAAEFRLQ